MGLQLPVRSGRLVPRPVLTSTGEVESWAGWTPPCLPSFDEGCHIPRGPELGGDAIQPTLAALSKPVPRTGRVSAMATG